MIPTQGTEPSTEVSVVIPCRNEREHIKSTLESIFSQETSFSFEVILADGCSDDGTYEICLEIAKTHSNFTVISNPLKTVPNALNTAIRQAKGRFIARMDMHSSYPPNYLEILRNESLRTGFENVGGVCVTVPATEGVVARSIAIGLSTKFGIGGSAFRSTTDSKPFLTDTVPFGFFPKELFEKIGYFDLEMTRNQDDEFNSRLVKAGGRILLIPNVIITYSARKNFKQLWQMMYQYGLFKPLVIFKNKRVSSIRQLVPPSAIAFMILCTLLGVFTSSNILFAPLIIYLLICFLMGILYCFERSTRNIADYYTLGAIFITMHFGYGIGFWMGVPNILARTLTGKSVAKNIRLSR